MKIRTCPHCNYQYSLSDYYKKLSLKTIWSEWECMNCGKTITFSMQRRLLLAIPLLLLYFIIAIFTSNVEMNTFLWLVCGAFLIVGTLLVFSLDAFKKA